MNVPKPKKLPSGNFRIQVMIDGKRYSITYPDPKVCKQKAKELYAGLQIEKRVPLTVGAAFDKYIAEKTGTLSPSTIKGYNAVRRNYLQSIMDVNITDLTQSDVQLAVSLDAQNGKSPKTIRNAHGLLAAVLDEFRPNFTLRTRLPQKQLYEIRIPTESEMQKIWQAAKDSPYELSILLASWLGLRMSEVRGLKYHDVVDGRIHVHRAIVASDNGDVEKGTKTTSGDRWIKLPETLQTLIEAEYQKRPNTTSDSYICPYADITIYKNFLKICEKAGVQPCRFHDLRHFAASEAHALGVPDKYQMKRMGHKTDNMLKTVYQHTMRDKEDEFSDRIDEKMVSLYESAHEISHRI